MNTRSIEFVDLVFPAIRALRTVFSPKQKQKIIDSKMDLESLQRIQADEIYLFQHLKFCRNDYLKKIERLEKLGSKDLRTRLTLDLLKYLAARLEQETTTQNEFLNQLRAVLILRQEEFLQLWKEKYNS